jgi:hypothetical protein
MTTQPAGATQPLANLLLPISGWRRNETRWIIEADGRDVSASKASGRVRSCGMNA